MLAFILLAAPLDEAHSAIASVARGKILEKLAKPLPVKHPLFTGTLALHDPKALKVAVSALSLKGDDATAKVSVTGEWALSGKLKLGKEPTAMKLRVKCRLDANGGGRVVQKKGRFLIRPLVADFDLASIEATLMEPEPFFGAKLALPTLASTLLKANKAEILKDVAALEPIELPRPAYLAEPGGSNDNSVLRTYASSMIAEQLAKHGTEKDGFPFDEKTPFLDVAGKAWIEPRGMKVRVLRLELREGVLRFSGAVEVPVRARADFSASGLVDGTTDASVGLRVDFDGDAELRDGKPGGCNLYRLNARLTGFDVGAVGVRPVVRALEGLVTRLADEKCLEIRQEVEKRLGGANRARLVDEAYHRVLGRAADAQGLRDWSLFLERRTPRELLAALAASEEYEKKLKGKDAAAMAKELRKLALGREPSEEEVASSAAWLRQKETIWEEKLVRVKPLRFERQRVAVGTRIRTSRDLLNGLIGSEEYEAKFGAGLPR